MKILRLARCSLVLVGIALMTCGAGHGPAADPPPVAKPTGPLSPRDEQATLRVPPGFKVELVACEPDVVDPVAMAFDERGRIYVAEMRGYPNGGRGSGTITSGRIKCLS